LGSKFGTNQTDGLQTPLHCHPFSALAFARGGSVGLQVRQVVSFGLQPRSRKSEVIQEKNIKLQY